MLMITHFMTHLILQKMSYYHYKVLPKNLFHFPWLSDTQIKGNTEKRHLIMSTGQSINVLLMVAHSQKEVIVRKCQGLNKSDQKLNFDKHVKILCSKANNKLRAFARATPYMYVELKKILINSFFNAHFNYCPLIWIYTAFYGCYRAVGIAIS